MNQYCEVISLQLIKINDKKVVSRPETMENVKVKVSVAQSCLTVCNPVDWAHQPPLSMGFSRQDTGVGSHSLFQGIFPTRGWIPCLLHCRWILYSLSHQGSPEIMEERLKGQTKEMRSDQMRIRDQWGVSEQGHSMMELESGEDCSTVQHFCAGWVEREGWRIR